MKVWRELDKVVLPHNSDKVAGKQVVLLLFSYITISLDVPVYLWRERCVQVCSDMEREMIRCVGIRYICATILPSFTNIYLRT
jgi:hypothetical protein